MDDVTTDQSSTSTAQSTATINNHRRPPGIIGRRTSYANHLPASPATSTSSPHAAFTSIISNLLFLLLFLRVFLHCALPAAHLLTNYDNKSLLLACNCREKNGEKRPHHFRNGYIFYNRVNGHILLSPSPSPPPPFSFIFFSLTFISFYFFFRISS